jgi:hypothetical protein
MRRKEDDYEDRKGGGAVGIVSNSAGKVTLQHFKTFHKNFLQLHDAPLVNSFQVKHQTFCSIVLPLHFIF